MEIESKTGNVVTYDVGNIKEIRFKENNEDAALSLWIDYLEDKISEVPEGKHFIYVTDTHIGGYDENNNYISTSARKSNFLIQYVKKRLGINYVIFGGDCINEAPNTDLACSILEDYAEGFYATFGKSGIWVQGNHDANSGGGKISNATFEGYIIPDSDIYLRTVKNIEDKIVFDTDGISNLSSLNLLDKDLKEASEWFKMHYWLDDEEEKIRYVVLETGDNGYAMTRIFGLNNGTTAAQYRATFLQTDFLYRALKTCPREYTIVVLGHQFDVTHSNYSIALLYYLYRNKLSQTVTWDRTSMKEAPKIYEFLYNLHGGVTSFYDFSDLEVQNEIIILGGHWHADFNALYQISGISSGGAIQGNYIEWKESVQREVGQPIIISRNRDAYNRYISEVAPKWAQNIMSDEEWVSHMPSMTLGTITECSFDIVTIKDNGSVVITRFGPGENLKLPNNSGYSGFTMN